VGALLALARMDEAELAREPVALASVVQEALEQVQLAHPPEPALQVQLQPLPVVAADAGLLRQVYVNLVGNALKFTRGVPSPRVEIGALQSQGETVLYVRDNGVGFEAAQAQRLFQPFERLHDRRYQGHGVGLSIVRRIVEHHGGRVWAESRPGEGAAFFFTLGAEQG
jgi:signal transduction histidine kinase